jgi:hypothetical protein
MTIEGDAHLHNDTSLVRVILEDTSGVQYMILEAYPLICNDNYFAFTNHCDETCFLDQANPYALIIQIIDGSMNLNSLYYETESKENSVEERYKAKRALDADKIEIMNQRILSYNMNWIADDNSLVATYYNEKKGLFGPGYNTLGYEYYKSGVFEFLGHGHYQKADHNLVKEFDWRKRHGANDPNSDYWDGDLLGTGWLSSVKHQHKSGGCYAFAAIGVTEALANISTVNHYDFDLSEPYLLECFALGSNSGKALDTIKDVGCITEYCFPFDTISMSCYDKCQSPDSIFKIKDTLIIDHSNIDNIRIGLIKQGPLTFSYVPPGNPDGHAVTLAGYQYDIQDSTINWIIKDSYGLNVGINGFRIMKASYIKRVFAAVKPVYLNDIALPDTCYDKDLDGYYYWGVGDKPLNCDCEEEIEDCDDSDPLVGGYDEYYNCMCLVEYDSILVHITSDTTWCDSLIVHNPIIIDSGACLTITAVVQIHPEVKITVDKGGKLILDGGILTNACPDLWGGINVLGSDYAQYFSQYFGVLEIKNGGTIENAKVAVSNYCQTCEEEDAGGIIKAKDGIFRNNQVAFEFAPFSNIYQGTERSYLGSFNRCQFIYDEFLQDYGAFRYFIKLTRVNGISFKGCDFLCDTVLLDPNSERSLKYKTAIYSIGSHFFVDEACLEDEFPCPGYKPSVFRGLNYGIYALGITGSEVISIKKSNFISNRTGIYLSGENYATIVQDTFKVYFEKKSRDTLCGLYLDYCKGFQVEENTFLGNYSYQFMQLKSKCIGIVINNSGEDYNEIYNNRFDSLYIGTLAQNVNRDEKKGTGLQILCNDYTKNYFDISVTADNSAGINGIADNQGSNGIEPTSPANNTFSYFNPDPNNDSSDYANECAALIYWYLSNSNSAHLQPLYYSVPKVDPQYNFLNNYEYEKDSCCPSSFSPGGGGSLIDTKVLMAEYIQKADSVNSQIDYFEDGGDTYNLRNDILTCLPEDADELTNVLISYSPYLSDSVMVASAEKEYVFDSDMITGILSENPQAAKSDTVQFTLDNRMDQLSEQQRSAIDQGWFTTGEIEKMKSTYAYYDRKKSNAFYTLARTFKSDTSMVNTFDSLTFLYQVYPSLRSKYDLVFEYAEQGDSLGAFSALSTIPGNYYLNIEESEFQQQAGQFLQLLNTYLINNKYTDLDSIQIENLHSLSLTGGGQIKALARNILLVQKSSNYREPYLFPQQSLKSESIKRIPVRMNATALSLLVYPNPAINKIQIELLNSDYHSNGTLIIYDISGKLVFSTKINKWQKSFIISTEGLKPGAYLLLYTYEDGRTHSKKLIISD